MLKLLFFPISILAFSQIIKKEIFHWLTEMPVPVPNTTASVECQ